MNPIFSVGILEFARRTISRKNWLFLATIAIAFNCSSSPDLVSPKTLGNKNSFNSKNLRLLPDEYKIQAPSALNYKIDGGSLKLYSAGFRQGSAVLVEIINNTKLKFPFEKMKFFFSDADVPLAEKQWGFRGLFALNPESSPGPRLIALSYLFKGKPVTFKKNITIHDANFSVSKTSLDLGQYSDVAYQEDPKVVELIKSAAIKKRDAFSADSGDMFDNIMSHPRDSHHVTSNFWAKRHYMRYRKTDGKTVRYPDKVNIHRGIDLRAPIGADVYSIAKGRVVLAEELYYEGNMVIVDHGNKIFSYYMHLAEIKVKPGEIVEAGKLIAFAGSTGISTAAHLHVSVVIRGVQVNPLSLLSLPLRD